MTVGADRLIQTKAGTPLQRTCGGVAIATAIALAVLLGVRAMSSPDLGYHLAYGDEFWSSGRVVDYNPYIYTLPAADTPPSQRPEPGPGSWYDEHGRYRFANANWLSQVIMSPVYKLGGATGLLLLQAALVAGIFVILWRLMRRLEIPRTATAAGLLLAALTAYERFSLRPELFGYLLLTAELYVLCVWPAGLKQLLAMAGLQLLLVNVHSYFMLGWMLAGAFFAQSLVEWLWRHVRDRAPPPEFGRSLGWRSATLAGMLAVALVNPWTWRLAILPIQTLLYMREHHVAGSYGPQQPDMHPWSRIAEFYAPFARGFEGGAAEWAFIVVLALAAAGGLAALANRKWAWAIIIAAMTMVSLSMRRNIAPAAMVIAPVAIAGVTTAIRAYARRRPASSTKAPTAAIVASIVVAAAGVVLSMSVVSQRFYTWQRLPFRFGAAMSELQMPMGACRWLGEHNPPGTIWTDYVTSSNVHYFAHRDVPALTNTWAFPPDTMDMLLKINVGMSSFHAVRARYGIQTVALRVDDFATAPLAYKLAKSSHWSVVYLDALHVVFLRREGPTAQMASQLAITPEKLDLDAVVRAAAQSDPSAPYGTYLAARTLWNIGWDDDAIDVLDRLTKTQPDDARAWYELGRCLAERGTIRLGNGENYFGPRDLERACAAFDHALSLEPGNGDAQSSRQNARHTLECFRKGILPKIDVVPGEQDDD